MMLINQVGIFMKKFGNCEIIEKLYETKYTEIYKVYYPPKKTKAILKALKDEFPAPELVTRTKKEYQIILQVNSPYSIQAYSIEKEGNQFGIIQEDIEGISLKEYVDGGKLGLAEFYKIAILMVNAIGDVHKNNIIHKDVNPSNFIYNSKAENLKIIDFGISTTFSKENTMLENPNVLEGTLAYISPEQTGRMNRSMDYRTDYYSLGITFYQLLTGKLPFATTDSMELVHSHIAKQATPPYVVDSTIPIPLSDLIMKLISKTAEGRYLSSYGLKFDLDTLAAGLTNYNDKFPKLGTKDISDKFQIPQKLYGREKEIESLLSAFEKVNQLEDDNRAALMLVSGYSGIGKSSLVAEIYKPITEKRGYFISGKFDQFQSSVPYSAIVNAFRGLIRQLLTESEANLQIWKSKLLESFDSKGRVITDVIPEVELITGEQPALPELPPTESKTRFNLVFQNFIRVFCSKDHPLVIFLDDLQWADLGTLKLIELIMTDRELKHFFLIGAYRDNEVSATHPFIMMLDDLKKMNIPIQDLNLIPLKNENIQQIIADTLHSPLSEIKPIADLIEQKTGGNPFFVNEFLKTLYSENLLRFEYSENQSSSWKWDIEQIKSKGITNNVVDLMIGNLKKLSETSQNILRLAACVGAQFDLRTLSIILEQSEEKVFDELSEIIQTGEIFPLSKLTADLVIMHYKFTHDRVQQAAYSLIEDSLKKEVHLKIGRLLLKNISVEEREDRVFEIINQLNSGLELIESSSEKLELAKLNLIAGLKAKNSNANSTALKYYTIGLSILPENSWKDNYELCFNLHRETALIEYTMGNFDKGKYLFATALENAKSNLDKVEIFSIEMNLYMTQGDFKTGINSGLNALKTLGLALPTSQEELGKLVAKEGEEVLTGLQDKNILSLFNIPDQTDKEKIAIMQLLVDLWALAYLDANYTLLGYTVLKITNMSLKEGNTSLSAFGYVVYGMTIAGEGKYKEAYDLGELALKLNEKFNNASLTGKINNLFSHSINPYNRHLRTNIPFYQASYHTSMLCGDLTYAGWALFFIIWTRIEIGENLASISEAAEQYLPSVEKNNDLNITYIFQILQRLVLNLLGKTPNFESFTDEGLDEEKCMKLWQSNNFDHGINWFSYSKGQLFYLYDNPEASYQILKSVVDKIPSNIGFFPVTKHNFYYCLSITAIYHSRSLEEKQELLKVLDSFMAQMSKWSEFGSDNFSHKLKLIEAEKKRIMGNFLDAQKLYDIAIDLAKKNGYIQDEAIANELCAKLWISLDKKEFAQIYLQRAYYAYSVWGATRKLELMEKKYPTGLVRMKDSGGDVFSGGTITSGRTITQKTTRMEANLSLDFVSILKASQIISGEIILEKLLTSLMKVLIENAGAEKGFLLLYHDDKLFIESSWDSNSNKPLIEKITIDADNELLSPTIITYVSRTKKDLVISDVLRENRFNDAYINKYKPKSVLCTPLLNQGKLIGIIYLENNLTTGAFTIDRIEVLKMLSSQAAISIENARLYSNLENITKEKTKVTTEMEIAKDIQTSLLPNNPLLSGFDVAVYMQTADLVGGDYYDVIHAGGNEWFVIGDVSGHGVTAGLIMMMTQTAIHTILNSMDTKNPAELLKKVNLVITSNIKKMKLSKYMTLTLFLKEHDGTIYYSGMHQDLLLYVSKSKKVEIIETKGSWLGYFDLHNEYEVGSIKMESGDTLLLFTDGITEAMNASEEMYDTERLVALLNESGEESTEEIKNRVLNSLKDFKTDDDVTFMVCKKNRMR